MGIYWALTAYQFLINPSPQHCFYQQSPEAVILIPILLMRKLRKENHSSLVLSIKELNQLVSHLCSGCFQLPLLKGIWPFAIISSFVLFWFSYLISKIIQYLSYIMLSYYSSLLSWSWQFCTIQWVTLACSHCRPKQTWRLPPKSRVPQFC